MTPPRALLVSWLLLGLLAAGCGKKGPPRAPLRPVPAAVQSLEAVRQGQTVRLRLTVPASNADGTSPADLARLEVFGLTVEAGGSEPSLEQFMDHATLVAVVDVRPPTAPEPETPPEAEPQGAVVPDQRPAQGDLVTVEEPLTETALTPVSLEPRPGEPATPTHAGLTAMPDRARWYLVVGRSGRGRRSEASPRALVPLDPVPSPPEKLRVSVAETALTVSWEPLPSDAWAPIWPLLGFSHGVNVFELQGDGVLPGEPANEAPVTTGALTLPLAEFGVPRCFVARVSETRGSLTVESALSAPVCETPIDRFPPSAPTGLAAVSGPGVISLIWNANTESDLAGYLVLRADAPGETLRAITPAPVRETTFRDTSVLTGVRYVYAVVAVDRARPPNTSAQSNAVTETAR